MGMFDDVICDREMPGPKQPPYKRFHVKDAILSSFHGLNPANDDE